MALTPESSDLTTASTSADTPSKTWYLDFANGKVSGKTDSTAAVQQAIILALSTPRYMHEIYSTDYGQELDSLIGKDDDYIRARAPGMIEEALLQDDRISGVSGFQFSQSGDSMAISFTVTLATGETLNEEVTVST